MVDIKAFRGIVYNPAKIASLEDVVAPPYDVIDEEKRETLYNQHPKNIVRLILGKDFEGDNGTVNKYARASEFLSNWLKDGSLARDEKPAIYLYHQTYSSDGATKVRKGFMAAIKLEAFEKGIVLPHEATLAKPVEDRLKLFRATQCNLSPVFGLYADREEYLDNLLDKAAKGLPPVSLNEVDSSTHDMMRLTDSEIIRQVAEFMKEKKVVIADGHHRYTTALAYKKEMDEKSGADPDAPYNYVLMFLTNMYGKGISVGPIHRLIHGVEIQRGKLKSALGESFDVEEARAAQDGKIPEALFQKLKDSARLGVSFVLYFGKGEYWLLKQKPGVNLAAKIPVDGPDELKLLDVSVVHSLLIEGALKITKEDVKSQKNIIYTKDVAESVRLVDKGEADMACLMNATRVEQVEAIAGKGYLMPQKSTFFYPKLLSGLVISPIGL